MNKPERIYILRDKDPDCDGFDIIAAFSVKDLIQHAVDTGLIEGDQMICPDGTKYHLLNEYLPTWRTELCLLSKNEFNDWFNFIYEIKSLPII